MGLWMGLPVFRSQTIVVSRWLVIPMAAIWSARTSLFTRASIMTEDWLVQISFASCSTQPCWGKNCLNSFWATETICPFLSKIIALELVVPWSSAIRYGFSWVIVLGFFGILIRLVAIPLSAKFGFEIRSEVW